MEKSHAFGEKLTHPIWNVKLIVIEIVVNLSIGGTNNCLLCSTISLNIFLILD